MEKIDPMQSGKTDDEDESQKIQVVCGLGVVLTTKGTIETIEIKGMPMPALKTAGAILAAASSEMQSHNIAGEVYGAFTKSMEEFDAQASEEASKTEPPVLGVIKDEGDAVN